MSDGQSFDFGAAPVGRSAGGFASLRSGRAIVALRRVFVFFVSPPVVRKNRPASVPASMFSTGLASAVKRAPLIGDHSPSAFLSQALAKCALRVLVVETLSRLKSSTK